jgi:hypothetical protein
MTPKEQKIEGINALKSTIVFLLTVIKQVVEADEDHNRRYSAGEIFKLAMKLAFSGIFTDFMNGLRKIGVEIGDLDLEEKAELFTFARSLSLDDDISRLLVDGVLSIVQAISFIASAIKYGKVPPQALVYVKKVSVSIFPFMATKKAENVFHLTSKTHAFRVADDGSCWIEPIALPGTRTDVQTEIQKSCENCEKEFDSNAKHQKYCSNNCRQAAFKNKKTTITINGKEVTESMHGGSAASNNIILQNIQ